MAGPGARASAWSPEQLARIDRARELEIAVLRSTGGLGLWTPIWVVVVDDAVAVRTWYHRDTGWYGGVLRSGRARIRIPGLEPEVLVETSEPDGVDDAYRSKYGDAGARSMTTPEARETTLVLRPTPGDPLLRG